MNTAIQDLEPKAVWKHFAKLAERSEKEACARWYVHDQAKQLGLEAEVDEAGNLIVRKPAHPGHESAPITALQGHLDMV